MKKLLLLLFMYTQSDSFAQLSTGNWTLESNNIKNTRTGRLLMHFPKGVWTIYIYKMSDRTYVSSFSSKAKQQRVIELAPGEYRITINDAPIDNVPIEQGKDTRLTTGVLNINYNSVWELYDETGKTFYTSGNKPEALVLPAGTYTLVKGEIKEGVTVKEITGNEDKIIETGKYIIYPLDHPLTAVVEQEEYNDNCYTTSLV